MIITPRVGSEQSNLPGADDSHCGAMQVEAQQPVDAEVSVAHSIEGAMILAIQRKPGRLRSQPLLEKDELMAFFSRCCLKESFIMTLGAEDRDSHGFDALDAVAKRWACQRRRLWFPTGALMSFLGINAFSDNRSRGGPNGSES
jgi:hypothetical protein